MHSTNCPFRKWKCKIYIYTELCFNTCVKDGRLVCPAEIAIVLLKNLSGRRVVDRIPCRSSEIVCPFLGHVRLQLQLITRRLGCITSLVNNHSKFILSCHNQLVLYSGWSCWNSPFQRVIVTSTLKFALLNVRTGVLTFLELNGLFANVMYSLTLRRECSEIGVDS